MSVQFNTSLHIYFLIICVYLIITFINLKLNLVKFMGNQFSRLNSCMPCTSKDIISERSLEAVEVIVNSLRRIDVRLLGHGWVFRPGGAVHQEVVNEIVAAIEKGSSRSVRNLLEAGWRLESAQALYSFLTRLTQPLVPMSIQSLVLDNNNRNVSPEVVAIDVLELIKADLSERHSRLIALILNLMDGIIKFSPADELRGNTLPISMLPLFFDVQNQHMAEWRRIVTIFVELIRLASAYLPPNIEVERENIP